jgi:hypothetical protein
LAIRIFRNRPTRPASSFFFFLVSLSFSYHSYYLFDVS